MTPMEVTYLMRDEFIEVAAPPPESSIYHRLSPKGMARARELTRLEADRLLKLLARRRAR